MKLTEKEFENFNKKHLWFKHILPTSLCLVALVVSFGLNTEYDIILILSLICILYYITVMILNILKPTVVEIEKDGEFSEKISYREDNIVWFILTLSTCFALSVSIQTVNHIKYKNKFNTCEITYSISKNISKNYIEENIYILSTEDDINIIELAKMAELECAYNFSDSLLKLDKSKPNRFEMQDVIQVIFNRIDSHHPSFANNVYDVLRQKNQFQPYSTGKFDNYTCSDESIRIARENYIKWKETGHSYSRLNKNVIGFCSAEYAEKNNSINKFNGWKRVEGKSLRVSSNGLRLHYFYELI